MRTLSRSSLQFELLNRVLCPLEVNISFLQKLFSISRVSVFHKGISERFSFAVKSNFEAVDVTKISDKLVESTHWKIFHPWQVLNDQVSIIREKLCSIILISKNPQIFSINFLTSEFVLSCFSLRWSVIGNNSRLLDTLCIVDKVDFASSNFREVLENVILRHAPGNISYKQLSFWIFFLVHDGWLHLSWNSHCHLKTYTFFRRRTDFLCLYFRLLKVIIY